MKQHSNFFLGLNSFYFRYEPKTGLELKNVDWSKSGYIDKVFFDKNTFNNNADRADCNENVHCTSISTKSFTFAELTPSLMQDKSLTSKIYEYCTKFFHYYRYFFKKTFLS